ncbi:polysaccharide biosynthesis/export family protein [Pelosinus fermentans]|uniref:Polysaccharide export protein n=1 Tax=Pelosinus fermentans JBW45 TaxID=1192197 RepID=I9DDR0_9FIRM|nr:polysaccharide biosynthesis/export family protein [Pelosinus fermentans]AJQ26008.1 polysaccharide export protein [Pelosinus fermentans JBW45]
MRRAIMMLTLAVFIFNIAGNLVWAEEYRLDSGDVLTIGVWGYEELQMKEVAIRPDGKMSFPIVGEVQAAGLSTGQLTDLLTKGLSDFVKEPKVSINIAKLHTTRVYVLGEVAKPGMYELEKQHNLLDALGAAGSYTSDAAKKKVHIIRKDQTSTPIKVNIMNIWEKGDMTQNYALGDGDVVYLSSNGKIHFASDILPWISATYQVTRMNDE